MQLPPKRRLTAPQVLERYGNVSEMWLWRRIKLDPSFPRPIVIHGRRFFDEQELDDYDEAHRLPAMEVA
jgi:predicted DNA-binding transcriptional regulator AlpA